ncbi:MAG: cytochrome c, partial [candidate division Zixibacteria bacterium]|nr:cytochrome c [candidate division Zixibacteria bacterium]
MRLIKIAIVINLILPVISGCYQGKPSEKPPIHLNPDMDYQPKYQPQEYSAFFENGAAMRTPPLGT